MINNEDGSEATLKIEGESKSEDMAAALLSPETLEYLDENPNGRMACLV